MNVTQNEESSDITCRHMLKMHYKIDIGVLKCKKLFWDTHPNVNELWSVLWLLSDLHFCLIS